MLIAEIALATIANVALGMLWYSPMVLGTPWQRIVYPTKKDRTRMHAGRTTAMIAGVLAAIILSIVIATFARIIPIVGGTQSLGFALVLWSALMVPIVQSVYYGQKDRRLVLIDGGFQLVAVLAMTLVVLVI